MAPAASDLWSWWVLVVRPTYVGAYDVFLLPTVRHRRRGPSPPLPTYPATARRVPWSATRRHSGLAPWPLLDVGRLAVHVPQVAELDLNPVLVDVTACSVVDAKLRVAVACDDALLDGCASYDVCAEVQERSTSSTGRRGLRGKWAPTNPLPSDAHQKMRDEQPAEHLAPQGQPSRLHLNGLH